MSNKLRSTLRLVAIIIVVLAVAMHAGWVVIPAIAKFQFWMVVTGFVLALISSK
ncbi:MAG: hypothetical protein AAFX87_20585 [Bacteroidota bacterium]